MRNISQRPSLLLLRGVLALAAVLSSPSSAVAAVLSGRAVDSAGAPISHVWVTATEGWQELNEQSLTDADGHFEFSLPGGTWELTGQDVGLDWLGLFAERTWVVLRDGKARTNFVWTLRRANARLTGRLVDDAGMPVPYVSVSASEGVQGLGRRTWTDAEGGFSLDLVGGVWDLRLSNDFLESLGLFAKPTMVWLDDGETKTNFDWVLRRPNARLVGRAVDDAGRPVSYTLVTAYESTASAYGEGQTDVEGWFELGLVEGDWRFDWPTLRAAQSTLFPAPATVTLRPGETRTNHWVMGRSDARLEGRVVDDAGVPLSHLRLGVYENLQSHDREVWTDAEGKFDFNLVQGLWQLTLDDTKASLLQVATVPIAIALDQGETRTNVVWVLPRSGGGAGTLWHGRFEDGQGLPLAHLLVRATESSQQLIREVISDAEGRFDLSLPPGTWEIRGDNHQLAIQDLFSPWRQVEIPAGLATTNLSWTLERASTRVRGIVLDDFGNPVRRVPFNLSEQSLGFNREVVTDAAGAFDLNLLGGTWRLRADPRALSARNLLAPPLELVVTNGEARPDVVWVLNRAQARVMGQVLAEPDVPVVGALLYLAGPSPLYAQTAGDGRFEFALAAGTWEIRVDPSYMGQDFLSTNLSVTVTNGQVLADVTCRVQRAPWRIEGTVRDLLGHPVFGVRVHGWGASGSFRTTSDDQGRYLLPAVDGDALVTVDPNDLELRGYEATANQPLFVEGANVELDLTVTPMAETASLAATRFDPDAGFQLSVRGRQGLNYELQGSADLTEWIRIRSLTVPISGTSSLSDTGGKSLPFRVYRAVKE